MPSQRLQEFAKTHARLGVQPEYSVHDGAVANVILDIAEVQPVSLIVMGTHGLRGLERAMLGSVTDKVLRKAHCPVLAVRKPEHDLATQAGVPIVSSYNGYFAARIFRSVPSRSWTMPFLSQQSMEAN